MARRGVKLGRMEFARGLRLALYREKGERRVEMHESLQLSNYVVRWRLGRDVGAEERTERTVALKLFREKARMV